MLQIDIKSFENAQTMYLLVEDLKTIYFTLMSSTNAIHDLMPGSDLCKTC